jgi:hypothetical protein
MAKTKETPTGASLKRRAPNRGRPLHEYVTPGGRKVWERWGSTPCYNKSGNMRPAPLHCHKPCRPHLTNAKKRAGANTAWMAALREFNQGNVTWCIPKRGTGAIPLLPYRKVMAIKKRIENERIDKIAGPPPPLERTDAFGDVIVPRKIPKVDAAKAKDARRRESEAEYQRKATEWAAEQAAKEAARYQEFLRKNAWTALPARETRSGRGRGKGGRGG